MHSGYRHFLHLLVLLSAALVGVLVDTSTAHAQSNACSRLANTLKTLERNSDYRRADDNSGDLKRLQRDVQRAESSYVRQGCNADAKAGRKLTSECRALARQITSGRADVEELKRSVQTGNAVAEQREAILQEMARFDCNDDSRVRVERERGNLFEELFGAFGDTFDGLGGTRGDEFNPYGDYHTVRTLCVRKTDGFYWPISYSTLVDYVPNDAEACRAQCPGLDVDLYYYDNPGQEPEQMINQYGEAYASLPNAFRFRTEFDTASKCAAAQDFGQIALLETADGTRAMVSFRGATFPLPQRDPRRTGITTTVTPAELVAANFVSVPLPRRRPAAPGETPKPVVTVAQPASGQPDLVVTFGDKRVRIVGPVTPYAQAGAAGT